MAHFVQVSEGAPPSPLPLNARGGAIAIYSSAEVDALLSAGTAAPAGWLSPLSFGALGNDPGDGTGHDDGPAFNACAAACVAGGYGMWVPPSPIAKRNYNIATAMHVVPGASDQAAFFFCSGGARILVNTPVDDAFRFDNFGSVYVDGFCFRGISGVTRLYDAYQAIYFASSRGCVMRNCVFKWLAANGPGVVSGVNSEVSVFDCKFDGCAGAVSCISGVSASRMHVERCTFDDQGLIDGVSTGAKSALVLTPQWIQAKDVEALIGGFSQSTLVIRECWFDETSARALRVSSPAHPLYSALIEDCQASAYGHAPGPAVYDIANVTRLDMNRCAAFELVPGQQQRDALSLVSVTRAHLDGFICATVANDANRIVTDAGCAALILDGMTIGTDYRTLSPNGATTVTNNP